MATDSHYELVEGPPWPLHLVAVLGKRVKQVTLVVFATDEPKHAPLLSVPLTPAQGTLVMAHAEAIAAAGFAVRTTYVVQIVAGKKSIARAELRLRE